jgi:hypothetical protein
MAEKAVLQQRAANFPCEIPACFLHLRIFITKIF